MSYLKHKINITYTKRDRKLGSFLLSIILLSARIILTKESFKFIVELRWNFVRMGFSLFREVITIEGVAFASSIEVEAIVWLFSCRLSNKVPGPSYAFIKV